MQFDLGGQKDPAEFISELVSRSLQAAELSASIAEGLARASATGREGQLAVTVDATGALIGVDIAGEPDEIGLTRLTHNFSAAYQRARSAVNQAVAGAMPTPDLHDQVLRSVPAEVSLARGEDRVELDEFHGDGDGEPRRDLTVDDLPPDPAFDRILAVLDAPDPIAALDELQAEGHAPYVNTAAIDFDAEVRAEILAITQRAEEMQGELATIVATATDRAVEVTSDAWGGISLLEFKTPALDLSRDELERITVETARRAAEEAGAEATRRLRAAGIDPSQEPTLSGMTKSEETP